MIAGRQHGKSNASRFPSSLTPVDRDSYIPFYAQVKEAICSLIEERSWSPGDQLPGELELCEVFDVSRTVIRQALRELEYEGLILREKGKGTFVAEPKIAESLVQRLTGFYEDMQGRGFTPVTQILKQDVVAASSRVASRLGVERGTSVIQIDRLRFVQGEPIVLVTTYLPFELCSAVLEQDLSHQSLYAFLENQCGLVIARGYRTIEAVPADEYQAQLLQVPVGAPLVLLDSVSHLDDGTPLEYYRAFHRGDRSRFEVELLRVHEQRSPVGIAGANGMSLQALSTQQSEES